jgi:hypothetical protein
MEGGPVGHNFERDPPKDHPCQIWFRGFRGEDLNVKAYDVRQTDGRRRTQSDGKSSYGLWLGELKNKKTKKQLIDSNLVQSFPSIAQNKHLAHSGLPHVFKYTRKFVRFKFLKGSIEYIFRHNSTICCFFSNL